MAREMDKIHKRYCDKLKYFHDKGMLDWGAYYALHSLGIELLNNAHKAGREEVKKEMSRPWKWIKGSADNG